MNNLRYLLLYIFLAGMFFDSFISALVNHHMISAILFMIFAVIDLNQALKLYDKIKTK